MISDRLIIQQKHFNNAKQIFPQVNDRDIILICGGSGTGKTETADCLQEMLFNQQMQSLVISLDDYYIVHPKVRNFNRKKQGIDSVGLSEIDWEDIRRICEDYNAKKNLYTRRYHKYAEVVEHNVIESEDINVLIFEGLYAGYLSKFGLGEQIIYLEGNPSQTFDFRKQRRKENEEDPFRQQVVEKEFRIICQLKKYANLIIPFEENK
jgi:phosphoribulokinase